MLIDVSLEITDGMVFRPGSPPVKIRTEEFFHEDEDGKYNTVTVSMPLHMGTHIDMVDKNNRIEPARFIGRGILFDVSSIVDREIVLEDLDHSITVEKGDFVFFKTGWDRYINSERYKIHPEISREILEWLVEKEINMVGIDALGLGRGRKHGDCDRYLSGNKIYVIENLVNLDRVRGKIFKVYCFPLKISETDAIPARVIVDTDH
ncbi:MAG: cyclase family protein [Bacillota bacterium]|nr:cyclase family protein [Bacillota bacterium]